MRKAMLLTVILTIILVAPSCFLFYTNIGEEVEEDLSKHPEQGVGLEDKKILFIMIDGFGADTMREMLDNKELPNIRKYLIDRGAVANPALTTVPSLTCSNMASMLSGRYSGHTGVPSMHWIDRKTLINRNYPRYSDTFEINEDAHCTTLLDYLKDEYNVSIFWPLYRNSDRYVRMFYNSLRAVVMHQWDLHDMECTWNVNKIYDAAAKTGVYPRMVVLYLISPDRYGHKYGPESEEYRKNLRFLDFNLGVMFSKLEKSGMLDNLLTVLVSDHGFVGNTRETEFNLVEAMEKDLGMKVQFGAIDNGLSMRKKLERYNEYQALVTFSGFRYALIYLNNDEPNDRCAENLFENPVPYERIRNFPVSKGITRDLIPALTSYDAVQCAMTIKADDAVAVFGKAGESLIERKFEDGKKTYRYTVTSGRDPLGYDEDEAAKRLLDGRFHDDREWLDATSAAQYPAVIVGTMELFDDRDRVGDIVLFAAGDCALLPGNKGSHGGLSKREMVVPLILAGPGIKKCEFGPVRTIDVMQTLMEYLGEKIEGDDPPDGVSFLDKISDAIPEQKNAEPIRQGG